LQIDVLTLFPHVFTSFKETSMIARALQKGLLHIECIDIRAFSQMKHKNADDYPFGGGSGMLMTAPPIAGAMRYAMQRHPSARRIFLGPRGKTLTQEKARELAAEDSLILLCGHYEGVDQRALDRYTDEELSIGDYILTGGETAAMVVIDCLTRLIPGVLGCQESTEDESFSSGLLEYPQYTRPRVFEGVSVPETLINGNHAQILHWRRREALLATMRFRPDLLDACTLSDEDRACIQEG